VKIIGSTYVGNEGSPNAKLWCVGEAPGYYEEQEGRPFVGRAGTLLEDVLRLNGVMRSEVFFTNLLHYRPLDNKFQLALDTQELKDGIAELNSLLKRHSPNCIAAFGGYPCGFLTGHHGITRYRGSILSVRNNPKLKVIPTYHPSYIERNPKYYTIFDNDIRRIVEDSKFPELNIPELEITTNYLDYRDVLLNAKFITIDIETVTGTDIILCVGFAYSPTQSVVVPCDGTFNSNNFISEILASNVPKGAHFGTYDKTVLILNKYTINNYIHDTIIQAHVLAPELPKSLAYLTSIYTRIPYYKSAGRENIPSKDEVDKVQVVSDQKSWPAKRNKQELYIYNGTDCCATYQVFMAQQEELKDDTDHVRIYEYEMEMVQIAIEFGLEGIRVDEGRRSILRTLIYKKFTANQMALELLTGEKPNVNSPKQMKELLYEKLNLPKRMYKKKVTTNDDALVSLITYCKGKALEVKKEDTKKEYSKKLYIIKLVRELRGVNKMIGTYIDFKVSDDGKARSIWKAHAAETGRWGAELFIDDTGISLMTTPRESLDDGQPE